MILNVAFVMVMKGVMAVMDFGNNVHNGNLIRTILVNCLLTIISTYGCPIVTGILNMNGCAMPVIGFSPIGLQGME